MSKKRSREPAQVNVALVEIYEDLAHENEEIRLKAAHRLLTRHIPGLNLDQEKNVLKRLFRGLCSGRKAARPGFAVALTETLVLLRAKRAETPDGVPSSSDIIDILEEQTAAEGNTSGQDERDHYFGRLFGVEAIIKSEILFDSQDLAQWNRMLDLICATAVKKPWIRQELGWVLYDCVKVSLKRSEWQNSAVKILEKLNEHKLIRSPEGLAVWIEVRHSHPEAKLPKHIWKHQDPLSRKDLQTLADVLKNARTSASRDTEFEVQGSATWVASLHFVWDVVLAKLFAPAEVHSSERILYVGDFWRIVVDETLLSPSSSEERKHWGLLVVQKALETALASSELLGVVMSQRVVICLIASLKSPDRYLQRTSQRVLQTVRNSVIKSPGYGHHYILSLLSGSGMMDFDAVTKTKTIHDLMHASSPTAMLGLAVGLNDELGQTNLLESNEVTRRRRLIINYQSKLIFVQSNEALLNKPAYKKDVFSTILQAWIEICFGRSSFDESMKSLVREKIQLAFEQLLKIGKEGQNLMLDSIGEIYRCNTPTEIAQADVEIQTVVKNGWKRFEELHDLVSADAGDQYGIVNGAPNGVSDKSTKHQNIDQKLAEGLALLYGLVLFEIHTGDVESIQILRELSDLEADTGSKKLGHGVALNVDVLVEILLGFASRPSKFLRRITLNIFETIAPFLTRDGLQSLTAILEARETKSGQQELFNVREEEDGLESREDELQENVDVNMLDSDVEVIDASESDTDSTDGSEPESGSDSSDESTSSEPASTGSGSSEADDTEHDNADLLALEASLAAALGTRKLTQDDKAADSSSDSSSDSDMTDSEMMALDNKLAEVFRNRARNSNESKKKEQKSAKENIVNFKNRVLDMLEVYVRQEHQNPQSLDLIVPLLHLSRQTQTKQLADRAIKLLQTLFKRCSGLQKTPALLQTNPSINGTSSSKAEAQQPPTKKEKSKKNKDRKTSSPPPSDQEPQSSSSASSPSSPPGIPETLALLQMLHDEAGLPNLSNAHRTACSKSSVLVAKTLLKAGVPLEQVAAMYDRTKARVEEDDDDKKKTCHVHRGFFEDWDNFRVNVQDRF